ncbi:protein amalgam-like [Zootermopsis nevadensis]|uniref:Brother of CDO n=1 Tax=Zootermopsis nevadensis TaxID=136037 RepID=A0A067R0R3_ZOONE|nr:protein amalgam-like [Zootermopsis nevadensis]KDR16344.1 Brother of CDO [Zootermopsis nevadensis]
MYRLEITLAGILLLSSGLCSAREPYFRSVPTTVKTSENDTVLLPCYVNNLGYNSVRWWWENQLVADSSNPRLLSPPRIKMLPNNTLQVSDLQTEDTGEYKCQIVRPEPWGPIQQVHAIEVLYPPSVTTIPEDGLLEVQLGEEVLMGCKASGVPHPIVTWSNEGEEMQLLDNRPMLRFQAHTRHLAGLYKCIAMNGVGSPATATIHLRIFFPPEIEVERAWVHAAPGVRSELSCNVLADPDAKVMWLKNDIPVITSTRVVELSTNNKHTLLFRTVHPLDFGYFKCRATNALGANEQVIQLSGVSNTAVFKNESGVSSETNYTLVWEVDSYSPIIEYNLLFRRYFPHTKGHNWAKLVIPADSSSPGPIHSKSYTLTGLSIATIYEAVITSRNRFGWSKPSAILRFGTKGADFGYNKHVLPTGSKSEDNINRAELAAILRQPNLGTPTQSSFIFTMLFLIILLHV